MILIFGTSVTLGEWDERGGWAQMIKNFADKKSINTNFEESVLVYPLGISGENTRDLLIRFETEALARIRDYDNINIIIEMGINDSQYIIAEKSHAVPVPEFEENIKSLIEKSKKLDAKLLFIGLTPVDERVNPVAWRPEVTYLIDYVKGYNTVLKEICENENIPFIDILEKFENVNYKEFLIDGLHPNSKGHDIIYDAVISYLREKNYI